MVSFSLSSLYHVQVRINKIFYICSIILEEAQMKSDLLFSFGFQLGINKNQKTRQRQCSSKCNVYNIYLAND